MEGITTITRRKSNIQVDRALRCKQILEILREAGAEGLTAKECAVEMTRRGYTPSSERNYTAPRLTELCRIDVVKVVGKKRCTYTGKTVAVFAVK